MAHLKVKKKKEKDGHELAGKIITVFFALILIVGIYFLVDLFRQRDITLENIEGTWKLKQSNDPDIVYVIDKFDENKGYGIMTKRMDDSTELKTYHYTFEDKENSSYKLLKMQPVDIGGYKAGELEVISITGVSKAQMSVIIDESKMKSMTRQDIF